MNLYQLFAQSMFLNNNVSTGHAGHLHKKSNYFRGVSKPSACRQS